MGNPSNSFSAIIFDIGDVLFAWSSHTSTSIPSGTLRRFLGSLTWFDYERGRISEETCYERLGAEFSFQPLEVRNAFEQARNSLQCNHDLVNFIRGLKEQCHGALQVFAMSNISESDYAALRSKPAEWSMFDRIFTSGAVGERKPDLAFYRHVLAETGLDPHRTVFVDDKLDNVLSARSLGLRGIVFETAETAQRVLQNLFGDPVMRGRQFLRHRAGKLSSVTPNGFEIKENFAQLLILDTTKDRSLVNLVTYPRTWSFFQGKAVLTTEVFPFDLDTTSLALSILESDPSTVHSVMNEMLEYVNKDGIVQTYFDHGRPRIDPVVCVNILTVFYSNGRGQELCKTLDWVYAVLLNRAYLEGTRYYLTGECFLYFIMRLLQQSNDPHLDSMLKPLLKQRVEENIGKPGDALALAMRILVCNYVAIRSETDLGSLLSLQCEDGGWEVGWIYRYGSSGIKIGNRGLTTALAINAVDSAKKSKI
ncbi:Haloacid dehalogenase-like hydrolase-domain-containing protein [Mycena rosella]|uniref:Haloacid dehalogenase-like hydrolase-domain-containing protein n=1 Tax=Mycena rosella TaxID=1033263 RepID=A0AAD7CVL1_MYCRO|nr:Haloacid dehalogenase-like hydrolase-domain-containing protein [Mycena rosella]